MMKIQNLIYYVIVSFITANHATFPIKMYAITVLLYNNRI